MINYFENIINEINNINWKTCVTISNINLFGSLQYSDLGKDKNIIMNIKKGFFI